ncbi:hypothetical protein GWI33_005894 [Rhynchophorus ferrugineus]|uniref:Ferritin n=1 Tax=Rhynchophorus ferrugineus TaxID=354439 RepID=A0A834IY51_RHYFE|nr:hypothetical protein GWI33_005894 [Rhynchophorus ferrugineus]
MKTFIVLSALFAIGLCADEVCYKDTQRACSSTSSKLVPGTPNCNAKYGAIDFMQTELQQYANQLLYRSFDFLLMSTYFGNYLKNRPGFEKLYRTYSDNLWNDGIELIKYLDVRGGSMDFGNIPSVLGEAAGGAEAKPAPQPNWELNEYLSLSKALDLEKELAGEVFKIHLYADDHTPGHYDAELTHHLEEVFVSKHRDIVRNLAGYTKDLGEMLDTADSSLAVYLFDELLQSGKY